MPLSAAQVTALDEIEEAVQEALGPLGPYAMASHAPDIGVDSAFMRQWYENLRRDAWSDLGDFLDFEHEARRVTPDATWDAYVVQSDLDAAHRGSILSFLIPFVPSRKRTAVQATRAVTEIASGATKAAKVVTAAATGGLSAAGGAWDNLLAFLDHAITWVKWILIAALVGVVAFVAYRVVQLFPSRREHA